MEYQAGGQMERNASNEQLSPKRLSESIPDRAVPSAPRGLLSEGGDLAPEYRSVSVLAVVSTVLAALSPAALLHPVLWMIPASAFLLGAAAWMQIHRSPGRIGRTPAAIGCLVGAFALATAVADRAVYQQCLSAESGKFGLQWFAYLAEQAPQKAYALAIPPKHRPGLVRDEVVWEFYRANPHWRRELDAYVKDRLVRTMLALGHDVQVRYLGCEGFGPSGDHLAAYPLFAVTCGVEVRKTTFFVRMTIEKQMFGPHAGAWRILRAEGGVRPAAWADGE